MTNTVGADEQTHRLDHAAEPTFQSMLAAAADSHLEPAEVAGLSAEPYQPPGAQPDPLGAIGQHSRKSSVCLICSVSCGRLLDRQPVASVAFVHPCCITRVCGHVLHAPEACMSDSTDGC